MTKPKTVPASAKAKPEERSRTLLYVIGGVVVVGLVVLLAISIASSVFCGLSINVPITFNGSSASPVIRHNA